MHFMPAGETPECETVQLIQMEYAEMPDLKLTFRQAQRLWSLSADLCERALTSLVGSGFLTLTSSGFYVRRVDGLWLPGTPGR
jgi:hypothetical protein